MSFKYTELRLLMSNDLPRKIMVSAWFVFATRGAMAGNKDIVDVLHFVGADRKFIAREEIRRTVVAGHVKNLFSNRIELLSFQHG